MGEGLTGMHYNELAYKVAKEAAQKRLNKNGHQNGQQATSLLQQNNIFISYKAD